MRTYWEAVALVGLILLCLLGIGLMQHDAEACRARGGEPVLTRYNTACVQGVQP